MTGDPATQRALQGIAVILFGIALMLVGGGAIGLVIAAIGLVMTAITPRIRPPSNPPPSS